MLRQLSFGLKALGRIHNFKTNNNYKSNIPFKIFTRNVITIIDPELSEEISEDEDENFWGEVCEDNDISRNSSYEIREHNQERIDDMKEFLSQCLFCYLFTHVTREFNVQMFIFIDDIETGGLDDYPNGWRKV